MLPASIGLRSHRYPLLVRDSPRAGRDRPPTDASGQSDDGHGGTSKESPAMRTIGVVTCWALVIASDAICASKCPGA